MTTELSRLAGRLLLLPILMVALAVLVKSYTQVGDGFTAGLIAVLAVVVQYLTIGPERTERWLPIARSQRATLAGLAIVFAVALQSLVRGEPLLTHLPGTGTEPLKLGTLELTTQFAFDIGIFLIVFGTVLTAIATIFDAAAEGERSEQEGWK